MRTLNLRQKTLPINAVWRNLKHLFDYCSCGYAVCLALMKGFYFLPRKENK
jgi:hypothetical protein